MPRKVNYGVDYGDDYNEYDYGYKVEENEVTPLEQETIKHSVWRCSICMYDNDETMSSCDICGVLCGPLLKNLTYDEKRADSGVSTVAEFLFASVNDAFVVKWGNDFHPFGNEQELFHGFHKAYSSPTHSSPYRLFVLKILGFCRWMLPPGVMLMLYFCFHPLAANVFDLQSSRVSLNVVGEDEAVKNLEVGAPVSSRTSDNSSASVPESWLDHVDESSVVVNMESSGKSS
ncbi:hypothetical protein V6N12_052437 [Hibiscus sabdariffa]|uniref:RanBP2-type domain-containing protein n=1 Tax=Hibiscus sabdariffa TaxID=183260 RepID=A0ABR2GI74_9ROSI